MQPWSRFCPQGLGADVLVVELFEATYLVFPSTCLVGVLSLPLGTM